MSIASPMSGYSMLSSTSWHPDRIAIFGKRGSSPKPSPLKTRLSFLNAGVRMIRRMCPKSHIVSSFCSSNSRLRFVSLGREGRSKRTAMNLSGSGSPHSKFTVHESRFRAAFFRINNQSTTVNPPRMVCSLLQSIRKRLVGR